MKYIEKHPMIMIVVGLIGISMSSILVKYSTAPSSVTAAWRLLWTVLLMTPFVLGKERVREELFHISPKILLLSVVSGVFLAVHFLLWFESLHHTSVASSTTIVCTEVIWVSLGYCLFLKGKLSFRALAAIAVTFIGSAVIASSDSSASSAQLYGDILSLLAAIAVAAYTLIGRIVRKSTSTTVYTYLVYTACTVVLLVLCAVFKDSLLGHGTGAVVVGFLLSVFSTLLGHSIFSWCLKFFSPSFVSASKLCEPVAAAILAGFLFGEIPAFLQVAGGLMIIAGVFFYSQIEREEMA